MVGDRVQENSSTTGTGTLTLTGAPSGGYQTFATAFPLTSTADIPYCAVDTAGNWETGYGVYTLSGTTLARSVKQSSNGNALASFGAGLKVFVTPIADLVNTEGYSFGTSPPTNPQPGKRWVDSNAGVLYVYTNDGTTSQWVEY